MRTDRALLRVVAALAPFAVAALGACSFDVDRWFERDDPAVEGARRALEASVGGADADLQSARYELEELLEFRCEGDGGRDRVIELPGASLDLGLVIFRVSELVGRRFGEEEVHDGGSAEGDELIMQARAKELDCAHLLLKKLASDASTPKPLLLRARYLLGNFAFLARKYKDAIAYYDQALVQHPARGAVVADAGVPDDDDAVARAAAWNRAIALRRLEDEQNDAGPDAGDDAQDSGDDAAQDANDGGDDGGDSGDDGGDSGDDGGDSGDDGGDGGDDTGNDGSSGDAGDDGSSGDAGAPDAASNGDAGNDATEDTAPPAPTASSSSPPPSSSAKVDLRELDRFDKQAPLDLDFQQKLKERKKLPKGLDK